LVTARTRIESKANETQNMKNLEQLKDLNKWAVIHATTSDKIVETLYSNRVTSENKRVHTPSPSPPFKVGVFVTLGSIYWFLGNCPPTPPIR